jgi:hypothetical protein
MVKRAKISNAPVLETHDVIMYIVDLLLNQLIDGRQIRFTPDQAKAVCLLMLVSNECITATRLRLTQTRLELKGYAHQMASLRMPLPTDHMRNLDTTTSEGRVICGYLWVLREIIHGAHGNDLLRGCIMASYWGPLRTDLLPQKPGHELMPAVQLVNFCRILGKDPELRSILGKDPQEENETHRMAEAVNRRFFGDCPVHFSRRQQILPIPTGYKPVKPRWPFENCKDVDEPRVALPLCGVCDCSDCFPDSKL